VRHALEEKVEPADDPQEGEGGDGEQREAHRGQDTNGASAAGAAGALEGRNRLASAAAGLRKRPP
jgi:hypothetical protein